MAYNNEEIAIDLCGTFRYKPPHPLWSSFWGLCTPQIYIYIRDLHTVVLILYLGKSFNTIKYMA